MNSESIEQVANTSTDERRSGGDFCLVFTKAVITELGTSADLSLDKKKTIRELCRFVLEKRPLPALPWAYFVLEHLDYPTFLREQLVALRTDKEHLLEAFVQTVIADGQQFGLGALARVLVQGFTGIIPRILHDLSLNVFVTSPRTTLDGTEGTMLDITEAAAKLENAEIDTLIIGAEALGIMNGTLHVIDTFYPGELVAKARKHGVKVVVIAGRYKMWQRDYFTAYAHKITKSPVSNQILIPASEIDWIVSEAGAFTPEGCYDAYQEFLNPTRWTLPSPALETSAVTAPPFFQDYSERGYRAQMEWSKHNLDLGFEYFARLLRIDEATLELWAEGHGHLADGQLLTLEQLWRLQLHMLSLFDFDLEALRTAYQTVVSKDDSAFCKNVPWKEHSISEYLASTGNEGIAKTTRWILSLRFANPY